MSDQNVLQQWGELIPQGGLVHDTLILNQASHELGRRGDLKVNNPKVSGLHCTIRYDKQNKKAYLTDVSCNGTFLFDKKLIPQQETVLEHGDIINILKDKKQLIGYIFKMVDAESKKADETVQQAEDINKIKPEEIEPKQEQNKKEQSEELKKIEELQNKLKRLQEEDENFEKDHSCVVCIDLLYNPFVMTPCLHNYCSDCMTELLKQKDITCPQCRVKPESIQKNYPLKNMIEAFIKRNPEKKWSEELVKKKEEKDDLTKEFLMRINAQLLGKSKKERKRRNSDEYSDDDDEEDSYERDDDSENSEEVQPVQANNNVFRPNFGFGFGGYNMFQQVQMPLIQPAQIQRCPECINARQDDNFKCSLNSVHIRCVNCAKLMPQRNDNNEHPQSCAICEKSYCNLYFKEDCRSQFNSLVNYHLQRFKDLPIPQLLTAAPFSNRPEELKIIEDFIQDAELRTIIIYEHMNEKFIKQGKFSYDISNKYMRTLQNKQIKIESDTPICSHCSTQVWNQMILKYRVDIKNELPNNIKNKPDCWYGIMCNTRTPAHNQRFNHACPQSAQ